MNGKKAKLMRKVGKLARKDKKLYNTLSHPEKQILSDIYKTLVKNQKEEG